MEPVTQALLGAASAEVVAGRTLGRRALVWGALIGMSPDIDVLLGSLHDGFGEWLYHRGTTHSLWFGFVMGPALAWVLWRWRDPDRETPWSAWAWLCIAALVTHPILDGFTPYGTQLFAPFWRERFAWNGVGIIDPFYTVPLAIGVFFAASSRFDPRWRRSVFYGSLVLTTAYLFAGVGLNRHAEHQIRSALERAEVEVSSVRAYPTVLQPWLRHFVARGGGRIYLGWYSAWEPDCPSWNVRNEVVPNQRTRALLASWQGEMLAWFAQGEVGIEEIGREGETVVLLDDLRYAWGSSAGRGMWGVQAHFDADDTLIGPITRFRRSNPSDRDFDRLYGAISGILPGRELGWRQPGSCPSTLAQLPGIRRRG